MNSNLKQILYNSISEARQDDYPSILGSQHLITNNSKYAAYWDFMNTNIYNKLINEQNIEIRIACMRFWQFLVILDKETQCLYSLMNSKRLEDILKNPERNAPLYLKALTSLNGVFECSSPYLPGIFDDVYDSDELLHFILNKLCQDLNTENVHYNLITFTTDSQNNVTELDLYVLDKNLQQLTKENLLDKIVPTYSPNVEQVSENDYEPPILKFTAKAEKKLGEQNTLKIRDDSAEILKKA